MKKAQRGWGDLFAAIGCILIGGFLFAFMGPSLVRDYLTDADTLEPAPEYRVERARCDAKSYVFNHCGITFVHRRTSDKLRFDYLIFGRMEDKEVSALKTPDAGYITTNVGMETIQNRNLMLTGFAGFMLACGLFLLSLRLRKR